MNKQKEYKQIVIGEYVATPIKNAFNEKTAYWLSKANCMVSIYMFTCENGFSEKEMFSDMNLATYIAMLEEKCKRAHDHVVYMEEYWIFFIKKQNVICFFRKKKSWQIVWKK